MVHGHPGPLGRMDIVWDGGRAFLHPFVPLSREQKDHPAARILRAQVPDPSRRPRMGRDINLRLHAIPRRPHDAPTLGARPRP